MAIKFICDIHISPLTISELEKAGFDIKRVTDFLQPDASDISIINLALEKNAVIITQDLDFSNLIVQSGSSKPSVVSIRLEKPFPKSVSKILKGLLLEIENDLNNG